MVEVSFCWRPLSVKLLPRQIMRIRPLQCHVELGDDGDWRGVSQCMSWQYATERFRLVGFTFLQDIRSTLGRRSLGHITGCFPVCLGMLDLLPGKVLPQSVVPCRVHAQPMFGTFSQVPRNPL